ncbi:hypothetical protein G9A89_007903 [Geosiphon pyriformis]|nr:hypothetical protein G9A89_007903 [Geosiphon pyriformis]
MENVEIKKTRPEVHDCNLCSFCQESIQYDKNNYCRACWFIFFEKLYRDLSSGNKVVDKIIKNPIYYPPAKNHYSGILNYYEWIPWERLSNINEIARGGFSVIYKATWIDGKIDLSSLKHHGEMEYERYKRNEEGMEVAIKFMKNSEEVLKELYTQRTMFMNNNGNYLYYISKIYGITKNAETLEYGIVMDFAKDGNIRNYLSTNFHSTSWEDKLSIARNLISGLDNIHSSGMIHHNLHSGNILQHQKSLLRIGDLGLCQPTNNLPTTEKATEKKKEIYGVVPYIPPEVLRGEKFTMAGDIYSFAMLLWQLATGKPPFYDRSHDHLLVMAILNGARPEITSPLIPSYIAEIIEKCWDANPLSRPTAHEVYEKLEELYQIYEKPRNKNFTDEESTGEEPKTKSPEVVQFLESDEYVKEISKNESIKNDPTTTSIHPGAVYTSRVLTLQMIDFSKELIYLP